MTLVQRSTYPAPPADRLITAEEFGRHPEWGPCELIKGKVVPLTVPKPRHGDISFEVAFRIGLFVRERKLGKVFTNDSGMLIERNPDTVRGPDVGFLSASRLPKNLDEYLEVPFDLCVEVVSPTDAWSEVTEKVDMYLAAGVVLVWVLDPQKKSAHIFRKGREALVVDERGSLGGEDVLPGFTLQLSDIFPKQ